MLPTVVVAASEGRPQRTFPKARGGGVSIGGRLLAIVEGSSWQILDLQSGELHAQRRLPGGFGPGDRGAVFADDGSGLFVAWRLHRWDGSVAPPGTPPRELAATASSDAIRVWRCSDDHPVASFDVPLAGGMVALRGDGRFVAGAGAEGLYVFDVHAAGGPIARIARAAEDREHIHDQVSFRAAFGPDGSVYAYRQPALDADPWLYTARGVLPPIEGAAERDAALLERVAREAPSTRRRSRR